VQNFLFFLGRFHVLVLHLPITLVLVVAVMEWLRRAGRHPELEPALRGLWAATALSALLTVTLGYLHFSEGGFTGSSALAHRALGTSVALLALAAWLVRWRWPARFHAAGAPVALSLVVLVTLTGHFGGNLTHGNTYLVQYAPNAIRRLVGLPALRAPVSDVAKADPYLDVVQPMLQSHCSSCHNADKRRGGLDLSTYASTFKGGEDGAVVTRGNAAGSELIRRVSLSPQQDDFMPKEGKTPLTAPQVAILRWWIDAGAKSGVNVSNLHAPRNITQLMAAQLKDGAQPAPAQSASSQPSSDQETASAAPQKADPRVLDALAGIGLMARQVSMSDAHLIVSPITPGSPISAASLQTLASVAGTQVIELDLRSAKLDAAALAPVGALHGLKRLRLDRNVLNDQALQAIGKLDRLEVLGLYGNAGITDASVPLLQGLPALRHVYVWQTGITARGVAQLRSAKSALFIDAGDLESANVAKLASP
jgi:hypothetical protein